MGKIAAASIATTMPSNHTKIPNSQTESFLGKTISELSKAVPAESPTVRKNTVSASRADFHARKHVNV